MKRRNILGQVSSKRTPGHFRVERELINQPLVSIIIPTKDRVDLLSVCIRSIIGKTRYQNYEIIIVDNNSNEAETFKFFEEMKNNISVMHYNEPFNYSAINNNAVKISKGSVLLFLNNDTEIIESDWLEAMLEHIQREEVGLVGAKLLYTNNTVQHAGVILGVGGVANHAFLNLHKDADGYFGMLHDIRNCSAVTGACMMVRRDVFEEIGGFNEDSLPVGFNDIDLSLKIVTKGYLCVWTPHSVLYHHESATRSRDVDVNEVDYMRKTWSQVLDNDKYYNSNFDRGEVIKSYSKLK
jgi:O-antigen biosynthesis protein